MMSLHDVQDVNSQMDTGPQHQPSSNGISPGFASLMPSQSDDSLLQNSIPLPSHDTLPVFPLPVDPSTMHIPLPDTSPSGPDMSVMDALNASSSTRAPAPGYISDFPPQNLPFGLSPLDNHLSVHSAPSTGSSNPSPAAHGMMPVYPMAGVSAMNGMSSIASSMNGTVPRTGPDSSASSTLASSSSELGFSPLSSGTSTSNHDPGFIFPPPDVNDGRMGRRDESPEDPGDSHLMVVGDILKTIAHNAQSASAACSMGQGVEAGIRIDELKKTIALVSELIAATQIADPPSLSRHSSPRRYSALSPSSSVSPPAFHGPVNPPQEQPLSLMQFSNGAPTDSMDFQGSLDVPDVSRKRCASSMAGDRVIKAPKREPQEDTPLHVMLSNIPPPPIPNSQPFPPPGVSSVADPRSLPPFTPSNPPSEPSSRPTSSAGLPPHTGFGLLPQQASVQSHSALNFSLALGAAAPSPPDYISSSPLSATISHTTHLPPPPTVRSSWSDGPSTLPHRHHQHSLSGSSLNTALGYHPMSNASAPNPFTTTGTFPPSSSAPTRAGTNGSAGISPPIGRISRSSSFTTTSVNPFTFGLSEVPAVGALDFLQSRKPAASMSMPQSPTSSHDGDLDNESDGGGDYSQSHSPESSSGHTARNTIQNGHGSAPRPVTAHSIRPHSLLSRQSTENLSGHGNEVPQEYRAEVDRIFFEFLSNICSNLDATDAKGEPIHQTLMAKKMQRLDESPDFRPFKFRIQAFTNAFLEELAKQGYPEEKIPMKKIRNYLWNQQYISRFNEDGKKTKSKGNHIWNIDAKKTPDGGWTFRPFHRKVAGSPPGVAYVGLRWSWTPRIWDPQASRSNLVVAYSSPSLPSWLSWDEDVLSGTPPHDAESCDITVEARYVQDGQEETLSQTFHLNIAPVSTLDTSFSASRRGSMNGDVHKPRRVASDSTVPQAASPRTLRSQNTGPVVSPVATHDAQVMQVLTTAAQRVAQEAQSQVIASLTPNDPGPELQALAKQQHVLTVTAQAFDQEVTGQRSDGTSQASNVLAVAAQQVVFQAARQVAADRSAAVASQMPAGAPPPSSASTQVTVNEVSVATQTAVAQAVEITGPLSSEVDVLMTASSLLQQQFRGPVNSSSASLDSAQRGMPTDSMRPHSTGSTPFPGNLTGAPGSGVAFPPAPLSAGLPEYSRLS
ncbi:hypothetical protein BV22DRAFT_1056231 [Leucogyrophana mollusca]|uniref:Uncharacterized protein n=1 Tax=Leucogyrophana mollusca TaxID=85980 RepID=A0ACB8BVP4_9AGAM|nr:hypothetical protein BV22DRAFT_1056231 [Leucogyrophana mollusca]